MPIGATTIGQHAVQVKEAYLRAWDLTEVTDDIRSMGRDHAYLIVAVRFRNAGDLSIRAT